MCDRDEEERPRVNIENEAQRLFGDDEETTEEAEQFDRAV